MNFPTKTIFVSCLLVVSFIFSLSVSSNATSMSNEDVIDMIKAKMNESIVLQAIESSEPKFDTSTKALINLKKAGASDIVIESILAANARPRGDATRKQVQGGLCPSKSTEHRAYLLDGDQEVSTEAEVGTAGGSVSSLSVLGTALTMGIIPVTSKGGITFLGARAKTRILSKKPIFMYILMPPEGNYSKYMILINLEQQGASRFYRTGEGKGGLLGASGTDTMLKNAIPLIFKTAGPNCSFLEKQYAHLVAEPSVPLNPGEYAVLVGGDFYNFGIDK